MSDDGTAARRWTEGLASWALPSHILDAAPEPPWGFPPALFAGSARRSLTADTPSRARAVEALFPGASVLDIGAGGGAASIRLAPPAGRVIGFDESPGMLAAFADLATERGVAHTEVHGGWPAAADDVETADVCVCHHVFYNVAHLGPFAAALTSHARRRVVVELTATHPQSSLNDLWWHFHEVARPSTPTADDAVAVLTENGIDVEIERWTTPSFNVGADRKDVVTFARRRLCLPVDGEPEVDALLDASAVMEPREMVTLWWKGTG